MEARFGRTAVILSSIGVVALLAQHFLKPG